jgi:hypothetical protein
VALCSKGQRGEQGLQSKLAPSRFLDRSGWHLRGTCVAPVSIAGELTPAWLRYLNSEQPTLFTRRRLLPCFKVRVEASSDGAFELPVTVRAHLVTQAGKEQIQTWLPDPPEPAKARAVQW